MSTMTATRAIDVDAFVKSIAQMGGECSFEEAIRYFVKLGVSESDSRDALWRLLSDGLIEFTMDRNLRLPDPRALGRAIG